MWRIIQQWLDGATARTSWYGAHGRAVGLAGGLRQGRALSPIRYCIPINCFLARRRLPRTCAGVGVPACAAAVAKGLYSQGPQDADCDGAGVVNPPLGRTVSAFLFVDDTTLVARTKAGLKALRLTGMYLGFGRKARMRLNHGESKVMHFRRSRHRTDVNAGFTVDGLSFEIRGA